MILLSEFEPFFSSQIIEQARNSYRGGELWSAVYYENKYDITLSCGFFHNVSITLDGDKIEDMCCDCGNGECRHLAAALFALRDFHNKTCTDDINRLFIKRPETENGLLNADKNNIIDNLRLYAENNAEFSDYLNIIYGYGFDCESVKSIFNITESYINDADILSPDYSPENVSRAENAVSCILRKILSEKMPIRTGIELFAFSATCIYRLNSEHNFTPLLNDSCRRLMKSTISQDEKNELNDIVPKLLSGEVLAVSETQATKIYNFICR